MKMRWFTTLVIAGLLGGLAACGDDDESASEPSATSGSESAPPDSGFNVADVDFAQGMIPHHEQAVEMAAIALDAARQTSDDVVDLARRINAGQDPEIELMADWLSGWGQPLDMNEDDGHDMSSMDGMMTDEEMNELRAQNGESFNTLWLEMMMRHHEGAIAMAKTEQAEGSSPAALALAGQIISAQESEIVEITALLAS